MFRGQEKPDPEKLAKLQEALGWLDGYLAGHDWVIGDSLTVADFVLVSTVSTFEAGGIDLSSHANVAKWLAKAKTTMKGYEEANGSGAKEFGDFAKAKLNP